MYCDDKLNTTVRPRIEARFHINAGSWMHAGEGVVINTSCSRTIETTSDDVICVYLSSNLIPLVRFVVDFSGGSSPGPGGHAPVGGLEIFFASILILLLRRLHTMGRGNT